MISLSQARQRVHTDAGTAALGRKGRWALFYRNFITRSQLRKLNAEQLKDIGLTAEQAQREAQLPFWR